MADFHELGLEREVRHHGEYVFAGAVALPVDTDYDTQTLPSREGRDDGGADPNLRPQTLGYPVAKGGRACVGISRLTLTACGSRVAREAVWPALVYQLEAGGTTEVVGPRGLLPGEPRLAAAEVAVRRGPARRWDCAAPGRG